MNIRNNEWEFYFLSGYFLPVANQFTGKSVGFVPFYLLLFSSW